MMVKHPSYRVFDSYDHAFADVGEITFPKAIAKNQCPICAGRFIDLSHRKSEHSVLELHLCVSCGWWHLYQNSQGLTVNPDRTDGGETDASPLVWSNWARWWEYHHAALERIELSDTDLSIDELRTHLARYWDRRGDITAQQAEDLVGSILRERHGGDVISVTANANAADGGIDLIIVSEAGVVKRAVQVKRRLTKDVEGVHEVRNFVGAMLLEGHHRGTFVTTANRFSKPARKVPMNSNLQRARLQVELIDGEKLVELLQHSALKREIALPDVMTLDQEWIATDGASFDARSLLLGDIRKLVTHARPAGEPPPRSRAERPT